MPQTWGWWHTLTSHELSTSRKTTHLCCRVVSLGLSASISSFCLPATRRRAFGGCLKRRWRQLGVPASKDITVDYSFDYAQQVNYPSDPMQPGSMYLMCPPEVWSVRGHLWRDAPASDLSDRLCYDDKQGGELGDQLPRPLPRQLRTRGDNSATALWQLFRTEQTPLVVPCLAYSPPAAHVRVSELPNHRTHKVRAWFVLRLDQAAVPSWDGVVSERPCRRRQWQHRHWRQHRSEGRQRRGHCATSRLAGISEAILPSDAWDQAIPSLPLRLHPTRYAVSQGICRQWGGILPHTTGPASTPTSTPTAADDTSRVGYRQAELPARQDQGVLHTAHERHHVSTTSSAAASSTVVQQPAEQQSSRQQSSDQQSATASW